MTGRPMVSVRGGRRGWVRAYLLGAGSVLAAELLVLGALVFPSPTVVVGTAAPATTPAVAAATGSTAERPTGEAPPPGHGTPPPGHGTPPPGERAGAGPGTEQGTGQDAGTGGPAPEPAPSGQPPGTVRLPRGGTATLVREELGPGAVLPVPENLDEATWWGAGLDAPSGASVFAGHVNWQGSTGPFAELWDIRIGDPVTVTDKEGTTWTYEVTQILTLRKNQLPARADELFGQSGPHRIVLVTCGGRWLGGTTGYAENRVVIAEPD